jgi:hypothetical protein
MKVWFSVGTEDINSVLDCQLLELPRRHRKCTLINANSGHQFRDLECLFDRLDVSEILLHLGWLVLLERVTTHCDELCPPPTRDRGKPRDLSLSYVARDHGNTRDPGNACDQA